MKLNIFKDEHNDLKLRRNYFKNVLEAKNLSLKALLDNDSELYTIMKTWQEAEDSINFLEEESKNYFNKTGVFWPNSQTITKYIYKIALAELSLAIYLDTQDKDGKLLEKIYKFKNNTNI